MNINDKERINKDLMRCDKTLGRFAENGKEKVKIALIIVKVW